MFFILLSMLAFSSYAQTYISGKLFNSETIAIFGDVDIKDANIKNSNGVLQISTGSYANSIGINDVVVDGTLNIEGNYDTSFNLTNTCRLGSLILNKENGSDAEISGDSLTVKKSMQLESGRIRNNDVVFRLDNSDPASIAFNDFSYIIGDFYFKTLKDFEYSIPVGDEEDLHLLKFTDTSTSQNLIKSSFCKGLPVEITGSTSQYSSHGHWELLASNETNCMMRHYYKPMDLLLMNKPSILQIMGKENGSFDEITHPVTQIDYNESWFTINARLSDNISKLVVIDSKEQMSDEWINFISLSSGNDTHFIIPYLDSKYSNIKISIYNNWGNRIFKSENYRNEFDASEYPEGTYYYQAVYLLNDNSQQMVKNGFFEIKN